MQPLRSTPPISPPPGAWLAAGAGLVAAALFGVAAFGVQPAAGRTETAWLAVVAVAAGATLLQASHRRADVATLTWLGVLATLFFTPPTAGRAVVVGAGLVVVAAASLARIGPLPPQLPRLTAASIGLQIVLRSDDWIEHGPGVELATSWLVLPSLAAFALSRASIADSRRLLIVGGTLLCVAGSWTPSSVLAAFLLALPARDRGTRTSRAGTAALLTATGAVAVGALVDLKLGTVIALSAALGRFGAAPLCRALCGGAALAALALPAPTSIAESAGVALLVVGALAPALLGAPDRSLALVALLLALAAVRLDGELATAAAPVGLLAYSLTDATRTPRRWGRRLLPYQVGWTALLLGGVTLLSSYPWLRDDALQRMLAGDRRTLLVVAAGFGLGALAAACAERRPGSKPPPLTTRFAPWAIGIALLALGAAAIPDGRSVLDQPHVLAEPGAGLTIALGSTERVSALRVEAYLSNSLSVEDGAAALRLQLTDEAGAALTAPLVVHNRREIGEWAAGRKDVRAIAGFSAPPAWRHQLDRDGRFFARHYRALLRAPTAVAGRRIEIARPATLPDEVVVTVVDVEVVR